MARRKAAEAATLHEDDANLAIADLMPSVSFQEVPELTGDKLHEVFSRFSFFSGS